MENEKQGIAPVFFVYVDDNDPFISYIHIVLKYE